MQRVSALRYQLKSVNAKLRLCEQILVELEDREYSDETDDSNGETTLIGFVNQTVLDGNHFEK